MNDDDPGRSSGGESDGEQVPRRSPGDTRPEATGPRRLAVLLKRPWWAGVGAIAGVASLAAALVFGVNSCDNQPADPGGDTIEDACNAEGDGNDTNCSIGQK